MISFTKEFLFDKIYACWLGKNIGGTLGTPYEGTRELLNIAGFNSKAGEPLPNDDLDLQLVWLRAVNEQGPDKINSKILGEYWVSWITPHWNEYGVCKGNMRDGILPPMSGEINNEEWKHSNGAWIRTEIWACLYPGLVEKAIKYAFEDASVDHGFGEGTYAAIFIAAIESAAFLINDINTLIDIGLSKIPEGCRVAKSVNLVRRAYKDGVSWDKCRNMVVEVSKDLGWFQAPANVAFVILGLLYGECDFKKSMIYAIDCGDDTDCTGATLGSILGIMGGMSVIPDDWRQYIGDGIKSICITNGHGRFPTDVNELTDCIMNLLPVTLRQDHEALMNKRESAICLGDTLVLDGFDKKSLYGDGFVKSLEKRSRYSYTVEGTYADVLVEFDDKPIIDPNYKLTGKLSIIQHTMPEQKHYRVRFYLPDGWTAEYGKNLFTPALNSIRNEYANTAFTVTANDNVEAVNRLIIEIVCAGRPTPILVPVEIMG